MAKRKRLAPPVAPYADPGPEAARAMKAPPIADVAGDAAATAALAELSQTLQAARDEGRMILRLPLDAVQADYLLRDRRVVDEDEMESLMASLKARGQQTPIEVVALGGDRYGLISGWRRLQALRRLQGPDGSGPDTVLAIERRPEQSSDAYVAMVEENEIRVGISFYERARIVQMAVHNGVFSDEKEALNAMFGSASRAKRSKIKSFVRLFNEMNSVLRFPEAIGERLGLALVQLFDSSHQASGRLRARLRETEARITSAADETAILSAALDDRKLVKPEKKATLGPDSTPGKDARTTEVRKGLFLRENVDGSLTISGTPLSKPARTALADWLRRNGG